MRQNLKKHRNQHKDKKKKKRYEDNRKINGSANHYNNDSKTFDSTAVPYRSDKMLSAQPALGQERLRICCTRQYPLPAYHPQADER
jgi:hypothetical protein